MKKKTAIILCSVLAVMIVCSICVVSFGDEISFLKSLGISSKQSDDTVLAEITRTLRQAITRRTP